jgi:hypothetical protein
MSQGITSARRLRKILPEFVLPSSAVINRRPVGSCMPRHRDPKRPTLVWVCLEGRRVVQLWECDCLSPYAWDTGIARRVRPDCEHTAHTVVLEAGDVLVTRSEMQDSLMHAVPAQAYESLAAIFR